MLGCISYPRTDSLSDPVTKVNTSPKVMHRVDHLQDWEEINKHMKYKTTSKQIYKHRQIELKLHRQNRTRNIMTTIQISCSLQHQVQHLLKVNPHMLQSI